MSAIVHTMENEDDNPGGKKPARRGTYPCYPLGRCIDVAKTILELGGDRQPVTKELIAQQLRMAEKSSTLMQLLSAVRCFGFITASGSIQLTELAMEYFHPVKEAQRRMAILEAVCRPKAFELLINRFDGNKVPSPKILENILKRECVVANDWISRVVSMFLGAMQGAGAVDDSGFLRYQATIQSLLNADGPGGQSSSAEETPLPLPPSTHEPEVGHDTHTQTLYLDSEKSRKFSFTGPVEITQTEYQRIVNWIKFSMIVTDTKVGEE